jgi:hypothetical protein
MWHILALTLTLIGVFFVYLTNKHQDLVAQTLPKKWRAIGYFCWLLSLLAWLQALVLAAAIFTWFFVLSTMLIGVPLLSLLIPKNNPVNKGGSV